MNPNDLPWTDWEKVDPRIGALKQRTENLNTTMDQISSLGNTREIRISAMEDILITVQADLVRLNLFSKMSFLEQCGDINKEQLKRLGNMLHSPDNENHVLAQETIESCMQGHYTKKDG